MLFNGAAVSFHWRVDEALSWALLYLATGDSPDEPYEECNNCENAARMVLREWAAGRLEVRHQGQPVALTNIQSAWVVDANSIYRELFGDPVSS